MAKSENTTPVPDNKDQLIDNKLEKLRQENEKLKREVKYLRRMTSSKRYCFAEKLGNGYNQVFPPDTRRRRFISSIGAVYRKHQVRRLRRRTIAKAKELAALADSFEHVIVLNSINYDTKLKQRPHHLATELSKLGYFVIYLEESNPVNSLRIITPNLVTINSYKYLSHISAPHKFFLSPNNMPTPLSTLKKIKTWGFEFIYDYLDEFHEDISGDLSVQLEVWEHLDELAPVLCLATAERLCCHLESHLKHRCTVIMVRNAVDLDHFDYKKQDPAIPDDLKKVMKHHHSIVGFYGALAPWIDFKLINEVADSHPEWEIVLIGIDYNGAMEALKSADNIHYLGSKNYTDLAKYSQYFDCAIIPFCTGEIAKATSPVKLFEYMATGLPTVCTRDLNECKGYDYVYMSSDSKEFQKNLVQAIKDKKSDSARARLFEQAAENTWTKRAAAIIAALS